jgi:hypothetical protein
MLETGQQWELFGYDMRRLGKQWFAAWDSVLWAEQSPLRERLDEVVRLDDGENAQLYQSGKRVTGTEVTCEAVLLPDALVLSRPLVLPLAAEDDLPAVLAIEVNARSPFSPDDTAYGWRVIERDNSRLHLILVIVSRSAVMTYLVHEHDIHDSQAREIWADAGGSKVVIRGFGENRREEKYRKRLLRCALVVLASAALILVMAGFAAAAKRAELAQVENDAVTVQQQAAAASRYRSALAAGNDSIGAANEIIAQFPSPHAEIARLTRLLGDDAYILQFTMNGNEIRLRGRAVDASSVMQVLTNEPLYQQVTAPQAIVKVANAGQEQFTLNITLARGEVQ